MRGMVVLLLVHIAMVSCTRQIPAGVQATRSERTVNRSQVGDTVYVGDSIHISAVNDTVRETRTRTIYRTRTVRDTMLVAVRDTVPVIVEVEKSSGGVSRGLESIGRYAVGVIAGLLLAVVVRAVYRNRL